MLFRSAAGGDGVDAAKLLAEVRRELLLRGSLAEAARCTFDELLLRIDAGRSSDVGDLTGALAEAFPGQGEPWAEAMARVARIAADNPEAVYPPSWELRRRLRQEVPADPARPPLLIPARRLTDRVLRRRGEIEDPIGAGGTL